MILDANITEKSFGPKNLIKAIKFSIDNGDKIGVIGRNGIGKSTLFNILTGSDKDFTGEIIFAKNATVVSTAQEYHEQKNITALEYILAGVPEYANLRKIIDTYPETMGDDINKINHYTDTLDRFSQKGFYQIEDLVTEEFKNFQLDGLESKPLSTLSGGQKRLVEVIKIMHSDADLALLDEPTNHMDYVAKKQFIDWMKQTKLALMVITHDRDVLKEVNNILELKDGINVSYRGNYDDYLKQNTHSITTAMAEFELIERRKVNLKDKVTQFRRLKEKARDPDTIKQFKRREEQASAELMELQKINKPTFWIDQESANNLSFKVANNYEKYKARNIKLQVKAGDSKSKRILAEAHNLSLGYASKVVFSGVNFTLRDGESIELRGRNGAGKTTLIKKLLKLDDSISEYAGSLKLHDPIKIGVYNQEVPDKYLSFTLHNAIEQMYLDNNLKVNDTLIRKLMGDYLFNESDLNIKLARLSGGQKARFQLISMLANDPQLLVLDEPTNHLDLPSIEELEKALSHYTGAVLYVSHDNYFREKFDGEIIQIG